jgi:hypothetical protein
MYTEGRTAEWPTAASIPVAPLVRYSSHGGTVGVRAARASGVGSESAGLGSCAAPASARPAGAEAIGDAEGRSGLNALGEMAVCSMASAEWWHVDDALGKRTAIPRCNTNCDAMFTKAEVTRRV